MIFALFVLFTALCISATAAYYSIVGLMAIFSGAVVSIAVMGTVLEVGKLVTASWLYQFWPRIPKLIRSYLTISVVILMLITSMGIFGYLSKAHLQQNAMSEEEVAQIEVYAEKLTRSNAKIQRWNDDIGRLNRGENVRVDLLIKNEQEQLNIIYDRIKDKKAQLKVIADEQIAVQESKLTEYAERTKNDLALLQERPDGKVDEETGKTEKEIAIDKVRKRDRGVSWVARDKMRKVSEQLRNDYDKIDKEYAPQIKTVNTRIQELRQQAQLKTEDIDTKIIQLEGFIESEQTVADNARVTKLQHESKYREIEVDVGPVKYIADMIYGDDARTMLDSAVRAVIITLIFVFDPLAVLLVVAGNMTIVWARGRKGYMLVPVKSEEEEDLGLETELSVPEPDNIYDTTLPTSEIDDDNDIEEIEEETLEQKMLEKIKIKENVEPQEDIGPEKDINEIKEVLEKADERTLKEVYNEMVSTNKRKTGLRGLQAWLGSSK
tara:strand:- start:8002 stop:9480 length:1479 start_codon:yes stop_codon:yes gene_type:complete